MNRILTILYGMLICYNLSCTKMPDEMKVSKSEFDTPVSILTPEIHKYAFFWYDYEATFEGGFVTLKFLLRSLQRDSLMEIRFFDVTANGTLILLRGFKDGDSGRACYVSWRNEPAMSGSVVSPEIGQYTTYLETNIDSLTVKAMYPEVKCGITPRHYQRIILDFRKPVPTLEFFRSIKFIE